MSDAAHVRWATNQLGVAAPEVAKAWSGENSVVYEITSGAASWFLKTGTGLGPECERIQWLRERLPFRGGRPGGVIVHGDACLPNVMFRDDGSLSGFVDLGETGAGDIEVDLAAAVWSLQYNLGPGHGLNFLRAYGLTDSTERDVGRLWQMYAAT